MTDIEDALKGIGFRPKATHVFHVYNGVDSSEGIKDWLLWNTNFSENELDSLELYRPSQSHLKLLLENGEDPFIVQYVWAMNLGQLDYFRRFEPTEIGEKDLMALGARWIAQAEKFDGAGTDVEFLRYHRDEAVLDSARARAYWVIKNKHGMGELWNVTDDSQSPEFAEYYANLSETAEAAA